MNAGDIISLHITDQSNDPLIKEPISFPQIAFIAKGSQIIRDSFAAFGKRNIMVNVQLAVLICRWT
jgi:hypothetical protein